MVVETNNKQNVKATSSGTQQKNQQWSRRSAWKSDAL